MNIPGIGEDIGWGEGFLLFFRLSLGGMCIGIAFGVVTVIGLYNLNRRLSGEDSIVQVVLTITSAYLTFFVSEILAGCSGIIAVMFCGVVVKAVGETMINDTELMHHFWEITEFLLNTLLFTIGGTVWGDVSIERICQSMLCFQSKSFSRAFSLLCRSFPTMRKLLKYLHVYQSFIHFTSDVLLIFNTSATDTFDPLFHSKDWGYLVVLYIMLMVIRYFLLAAFYPCKATHILIVSLYDFNLKLSFYYCAVISRIGIGTNWKEAAVSTSYLGIRYLFHPAHIFCIYCSFRDGVGYVGPWVLR